MNNTTKWLQVVEKYMYLWACPFWMKGLYRRAFQRGAHVDDWHSHELEQALALIVVLLSDPHSALGVLGHIFCIASLQANAQ